MFCSASRELRLTRFKGQKKQLKKWIRHKKTKQLLGAVLFLKLAKIKQSSEMLPS